MRILMIHDSMNLKGGAALYVNFITKAFKQLGHQVDILSLPKKFLAKKNNALFFNFKLYAYFKNQLKYFRPQVIHFHNIHHFQNTTYLAGFWYSLFNQTKIVKTFHDYWFFYPWIKMPSWFNEWVWKSFSTKNIFWGKWLEKWLLKTFTLIAPSEELQLNLKKRGLNAKLLPYPIIMPQVTDITTGRQDMFTSTIVYIGLVDKFKGVKVPVKALKYLDETYRLIIIGTGNYKKHLKKISRSDTRIKFVGWQSKSKINSYIKNSSLVTVPSLMPETGPMVIIEAMSLGKPIVGSNIEGIRELINKNNIGLLFEPGNEKDLAKKIDLIINHKNLYNKFSKNALTAAKKYSAESHLANLLNIYGIKL